MIHMKIVLHCNSELFDDDSIEKEASIVNRVLRDVCSSACEVYAIVANEIT